MTISDEQVRIAMRVLQDDNGPRAGNSSCEVPPGLLERVRHILDEMPECREERVNEARHRLESAPPTSDEVAEMIIGRIISESLR